MNSLEHIQKRRRRRKLFIVEGDHEKDVLVSLLSRCFPELGIIMDDVWIYGSNIYKLYGKLVNEYKGEWDEEEIDIVHLLSEENGNKWYKEDFTSVFMFFDYERQEGTFDEAIITKMQNYFNDENEVGKLFLNYPMVEAYQHIFQVPDNEYENLAVAVSSVEKGYMYKNLVDKSIVCRAVNHTEVLKDVLKKRFGKSKVERFYDGLSGISTMEELNKSIEKVFWEITDEKKKKEAVFQIASIMSDIGYLQKGMSYIQFMRQLFQSIIIHNICKANKILNDRYNVADYKEAYQQIDLEEILKIQNRNSYDKENGFIWVLSTCLFLVADHNFALVYE